MKKIQLLLATIFTFMFFITNINAAGKAEKYMKQFEGKDFMMHFIMHNTINKKPSKSDVTLANKGKKQVTKMTYEGKPVRILMEEKKIYMIVDQDKMAMDLNMIGINPSTLKQPDYVGVKITSSGTDTVMGKKLPYEEMDVKNGGKIRYYFEGEKLAYITGKNLGNDFIMEILECTSNVPASLFEIPKGYRVMDGIKSLGL